MQIRLSELLKKMLITYVVIYVIQVFSLHFLGNIFNQWFALTPSSTVHGMIWQLFSYSFLHADVMHLVFNMMVLVFVGGEIEAIWGRRRFLQFYSFCILFVGLVYFLFQMVFSVSNSPLMGASGGLYGLMMAYAILFPERELLFMMMFPLKSKQFVMIISAIEFLQLASNPNSGGGLGAIAHLSGLGAGWLFLWLQAKGIKMDFNRSSSGAAPAKKRSSHLKLVPDRKKDEEGNGKGPKTWH